MIKEENSSLRRKAFEAILDAPINIAFKPVDIQRAIKISRPELLVVANVSIAQAQYVPCLPATSSLLHERKIQTPTCVLCVYDDPKTAPTKGSFSAIEQ